jgi:hypothetical protein
LFDHLSNHPLTPGQLNERVPAVGQYIKENELESDPLTLIHDLLQNKRYWPAGKLITLKQKGASTYDESETIIDPNFPHPTAFARLP